MSSTSECNVVKDEKAQRFSALLKFLNANEVYCASCDPCDCGCQCANSLQALNGDASFRVYYRFKVNLERFKSICNTHKVSPYVYVDESEYTGTVIIVDAPPSSQKNLEFVLINQLLHEAKVLVPRILVKDIEQGFMVLEDLGSKLFIDVALGQERLNFYFQALIELSKIAALPYDSNAYERLEAYRLKAIKLGEGAEALIPSYTQDEHKLNYIYKTLHDLPKFDRDFMLMECNIFNEWLLDKALHLELNADEKQCIDNAFDFILNKLLTQPQVAMHRDYHSRNLMVLKDENSITKHKLAIIDYQDMVLGPVGYDVASLVYDCYTVLSDASREKLLAFAYEVYSVSGIVDESSISLADFSQMVKLCALQRHIKCLGLFYRLKLRDGKDSYLQYLPTVLTYVLDNAKGFRELEPFTKLLNTKLAPHFGL